MDYEDRVDAVGRRAVESLIREKICRSVTYVRLTESTNTLALKDLQNGSINDGDIPRLYLADNQTAGRGRHGRNWLSGESSLTFSMAVDRPGTDRAAHLLSLAVGVGVARSIEHEFAPFRTALKWPNDVYAHGGKLAGILIETSSHAPRRIVIGVGMNIGYAPEVNDSPYTAATQSLSTVVGRPLHRYDVLGPLVAGITESVRELQTESENIVNEFRDRCMLTGQTVTFQDGSDRREGICRGISDQGELIVESDRGTQHVRSGEARLVRTKT